MYFDGKGVTQDYVEAAKWFRMAADQGNSSAQSNLGVMHALGRGVTQDYVQAYMWMHLSVASSKEREGSSQAATLLDEIAMKMTPQQIAEAQRLAGEWKPNPAK